ncbi:MAG: NAD-dependent epimerase [Flavobacteriia bacterium]|uniref:NAD-dependent epimerase n=1 Tax=Shewanella sp. CG_4_10_14_0_8_um_filter_42_13 TaxID=1975534 RepID=UPI000CC6D9F2|nr:NAD-dependent epimerase [Shewanella sp. CG_4_10_14_0_8_um_filter_42_13]NCT11075.1 NAD-dependent epimerase [Flavobacteriia bacterium]PIY68497.1 MAG: NAD-dependent epimerase [Shewanella sp. CG_4_10_14_0_8_um_filter_42_13]
MKILVTGAAGFIGYHLCEELIAQGHIVLGIDNVNDYYDINLKYARLAELGIVREQAEIFFNTCKSETFKDSFQFVRMNLEDRIKLPILFEDHKFDIVCHLGAQAGVRYSIENPETYIDSNIVGFLNILECCRHHHIGHLLYASSSSVYGENKKIPFSTDDNVDYPISLYAATKKSNELMAYTYSHLFGIPTSGLRFFTVYGPWGRPDMAPILFANSISKNEPIKVFNNGDMSRDFTYIDDIVNGIQIVLHNPPSNSFKNKPYKVYNIGNGSPESLGDFIKEIENNFGVEAKKIFLPMQAGDVPRTWADISEIKKLGYKSTTKINEGVSKFVEWFKKYYNY